MRILAWWIIIKKVLVQAPGYKDVLSQIKRKIGEIEEEKEEEEKNRVVDVKNFLRNQAIRKNK